LDFVLATQPQEWERLKQHHGAEVKDRFVRRVAQEIAAASLGMSRSCAVTSQLLPQASYLGLGRF
jgi:hypothetical protein